MGEITETPALRMGDPCLFDQEARGPQSLGRAWAMTRGFRARRAADRKGHHASPCEGAMLAVQWPVEPLMGLTALPWR